ncbi:MAG: NAD(P)/FAD-dependent oxidoreductase [Candidatus Spechtbacterales bacterium]|nr:NAD(P)/FAD-dependent oxidoreductase [Candidatus Spechtbacterales bacterium]
MGEQEVFDLLIIGGGPAGLNAAFWAFRQGKKVAVVEMQEECGGQVTGTWGDKTAYDLPGFAAITGNEYIEGLKEQALNSPLVKTMKSSPDLPKLFSPEKATSLVKEEVDGKPIFTVTLEKLKMSYGEVAGVLGEHSVQARTILITAGLGTTTPTEFREPEINKFSGKGLNYIAGDLEQYRDKKVLVVGGGDSAVDWAHQLDEIAESVTLIHRRDGFRATELTVLEHLMNEDVVRVFYEVDSIEGDECVEGVWIRNNKTDEKELLEIDKIIACLGQKPNLGIFEEWGLELGHRNRIKVRTEDVDGIPVPAFTNVEGIFAAGEASTVHTNLIAFDIAFAGLAALTAVRYLDPGKKLCPRYSSKV